MSGFVQDLQYGLRSFRKNPAFAAVAVLTLALGVGANSAIFSVLRAVVLRDLPYRDAERIAVMWTKNIRQDLPDGSSYLNFRDWRELSRSFEQMAAYMRPEFTRDTLAGGPGAERLHAGHVGPGFFQLLGTAALAGRTLEAADYTPAPRAVVISHRLWQQRFGADRGVIGRSITLSDMSMEIVGVMPPGFELPTPDVQLWRPLVFGPQWQEPGSRGWDALVVVARLAPGATIASARTEMDAIAARLREQYPDSNAGLGVLTDSLTERVIGSTTERSLWLLFGSVGFVLLIACANVANLALARGAARRNEFSVRAALGAGKGRLVRQSLTENVVLGILAAGVGLLLAWGGTAALRNLAPGALPRAETIAVDPDVLVFLLLVSIGSGLLAGVLPALQLSITNPASVLREGGPRSLGGRSSRRVHQALVMAEIGLAVVLMTGAGLLLRSFQRVQTASRGFDSTNVLLLQTDLQGHAYAKQEQVAAYYQEALRRLRTLPGVVAAGAVGDFFIHRQPDSRMAVEGQPIQRFEDPAPPLTQDDVIPGYFEAMRIPVLRGRTLVDSDLAPGAPPVIVINEEMARRFFPGQDPVGRRVRNGRNPSPTAPWITVVGVVADMRRQRLDEPAIPCTFRPGINRQMDIALRTAGDPDLIREAIRAELRALDPNIAPYGIVTVEQRLARTVALRRLQTMLLAGLAGVALILSVVGAYGVVGQSVAARTQEIGIRMALGANAPAVLRIVLAGGLGPAIAGAIVGLLGSLALRRTISTFLYETSALDPLIYTGVIALLLGVTSVACLAPAARAARVDPVAALRND
jgi:putative ABC transport system permease protein